MLATVSFTFGILLAIVVLAVAHYREPHVQGLAPQPTRLGWLTLAFGLTAATAFTLAALLTPNDNDSGLRLWLLSIALGPAAVLVGAWLLRRRDRHWPTWVGFVAGLMVAIFWIVFAAGNLLGLGASYAPDFAPQELDIDAGDVTLHVRMAGNPEAAHVLIASNGGPGLTSSYMLDLEQLAGPDLLVVTYDQRGNGRSSSPTLQSGSFDLPAYAADVEAIRQYLAAPQVYLFGHSFGGLVNMQHAAQYPQHVAALIFYGSGPPRWNQIMAGLDNMSAHVADLIARGVIDPTALENGAESGADPLLPAYFSDPSFTFPVTGPASAPEFNAAVNELTWAAMAGYDFAEPLAAFNQPALILWGADDPFGVAMGAQTRDALQASSNLRYVSIPDCGHFWHECPATFYAEMRQFLAGATE
jgi:pimeloyl-ACP methyl ester carboxylesterase